MAAAVAALLYGFNGSLSKIVLQSGLPAQRLTEVRVSGSLLVLLGWRFTTSRGRPALRRAVVVRVSVYGFVGVAVVQWLYFVAIRRLPVGVALLIEFTAPLLVAVWLAAVHRRAAPRVTWVGLGASLLGLLLVADVGWHVRLDAVGVGAAVGAAVGLACYYVLGRTLVAELGPLDLTTCAFAVAALFWAVLAPWWSFPWSTLPPTATVAGGVATGSAPVWLLVVGVVVVGTVLPYLLVASSLRRLAATRVAVLGMLEPIFAIVFAWTWLGESLSIVQVVGAGLVVVGVTVGQLGARSARAGTN